MEKILQIGVPVVIGLSLFVNIFAFILEKVYKKKLSQMQEKKSNE